MLGTVSRPSFSDGEKQYPDAEMLNRFCLHRHGGAINGAFLDFHVERVGLKSLWARQWAKTPRYVKNGPWTKAGGVMPTDWPDWM